MIKKLNNKTLLLILVALLAVFAISRYISAKKGENTFHTAIIPKIDSNRMNGMVIFPSPRTEKSDPTEKKLPYIFTREGKAWYVSKGNFKSLADAGAAAYMIKQLEDISPDRLGATNPNEWKQYDVTDSLGTRVVLLYDKDTALDVIVGRFSFLPQEKKSMTYLRLLGHNEVYAVQGYLAMNINGDFDTWRSKKLTSADYHSWTKLTFTYPNDSGFVIAKDGNNQWVFGDGTKADSIATLDALKTISQQNYGSFLDKYDSTGKQPILTLRVEGDGFSPVLIKAYPAAGDDKYAINTTLNPGSFISGNTSNGMYSKIFLGKAVFSKQ